MKKVVWMGSFPSKCDLCGRAIVQKFVDGKTKMGPWGILCQPCHREAGVGLGLGMGQLYARQKDGRFMKVGG